MIKAYLKKIKPLKIIVRKLKVPYRYLILKYFLSYLPHKILHRIELVLSTAQGRGQIEFPYVLSEEVKNCLKLIENPNTVIDVGANVGLYTEQLFKKFPNSKYFLFEPSKTNTDVLNKKFHKYNNVKIFRKALSNNNGKSELFSVDSGNVLNSLIKQDFFHDNVTKFNFTQDVEVSRLDHYDLINDLQSIDYVKIDTEGNEFLVLQGFGNNLKKCKLIQFEFGLGTLYAKNYFIDFWNFFKNNNFSLYIITPSGPKIIKSYSYIYEHFDAINFIALNNKYK